MAYFLYKKIRDHQRAKKQSTSQVIGEMQCDSNGGSSKTEKSTPESGMLENDKVHLAETDRKKHEERIHRWRLMAGILCPATLQSLNVTLVAAAVPFIASDFDQLGQINWIISAFNLTSAAFIPAWGQFADIFGRYWALQASLLFMTFGSALCAGSPTRNFAMLLAGRGLQGVGSAGLSIIIKIILADGVTLEGNAKNNSIFSLVIGIGYTVGPVVGGYLTDVSWRWCFIINLPLCVAGVVLTHFVLRPILYGPQDMETTEEEQKEVKASDTYSKRLASVDYGGQMLFLFGMGLAVLALTWAGAYYPWGDAKVISTLVVGVVLLLAFLVWEHQLLPGRSLARAWPRQRAMIPMDLLWSRNAGILMYINLISGMAMYAVFYFIALYFTIARGMGPGDASKNLLYYVPGLGAGAVGAALACNVWPRRSHPPLMLGTVAEALGITLVAVALRSSNLHFVYGVLVLTGFGTGIRMMPGTLHGVGYYRRRISSIMSMMIFAMSAGGTLASTIMLNIFNNRMTGLGPNVVAGTSSVSSLDATSALPEATQMVLRQTASNAIVLAFFALSSFMWLGVVAMFFLGNVDIDPRSASGDTDAEGETNAEYLTRGAYLTSFFRRSERDVATA